MKKSRLLVELESGLGGEKMVTAQASSFSLGKFWKAIHTAFQSTVAMEYDTLASTPLTPHDKPILTKYFFLNQEIESSSSFFLVIVTLVLCDGVSLLVPTFITLHSSL
ncbi:hypothetical protein GYH30_015814 [Glycine max]|nr:hypothetical protein GYH30_015814 [Glycine max]